MKTLSSHAKRHAARLHRGARSLLWLGLLTFAASGCVRPGPAESRPTETFELLHERKLSAFERELAMERHLAREDGWNRVGQAWLDLVNCTHLERSEAPIEFDGWTDGDEPLAKLMYATLVLEMRRRNAWALDETSLGSASAFSHWFDGDFFEREPAPLDASLVKWPGEEEAWEDEGLAPVVIQSECSTLDERLLTPPDDPSGDPSGNQSDGGADELPDVADVRRKWAKAQLDAAEEVAELEASLPAESAGGSLTLLMWRVRVHGAHLALELARDLNGDEDAAETVRAQFVERGRQLLAPLSVPDDAEAEDAPAPPRELARMLFLRARLASSTGDVELDSALADLRRALDIGLRPPNDERARYLALRLATNDARWQEALSLAKPMPPRSSPLFEPFAYRLSLAARQTGAEDRFLRIAMETLGASAPGRSAFLGAIYADALALLASYRFDERVVEILEDLGPANQVFRRVAQLSRVALERGYLDNATASAKWLLARHHNHRYTPRYRGLLAIAAFLEDDEDAFREQVRAMTRRHPNVARALGEARQAEFFAHADRTFARLMGQMLPAMAEWGDDAGAELRRQRWLEISVEETQRFLRTVERSKVHPELIELYRLASELLEEHPRGYAARLGSEEPTPLILGTVQVGQGDLIAQEPDIVPSIPEPYFLSLVPRAKLPVQQWSFSLPTEKSGGSR